MITNFSWYISYRFSIFSGIFSKSAKSCSLIHRGPTTGPQAACGPLQRYQWPAEAFMKNFKSEICWKACEVTFISLNSSFWIKCICTRTMKNTFSVYHRCFWFYVFIYFTIKLEGRPSDNPPLEHITGQALCSSLPQLSLSWRIHLEQWTQYRQINLSIHLLNADFSK